MASTLLPGRPYPLGAKWDGTGVNFAIYSENATAVELCLFDEDGRQFAEIFAAAGNELGRVHMLGYPVALTEDIARSG